MRRFLTPGGWLVAVALLAGCDRSPTSIPYAEALAASGAANAGAAARPRPAVPQPPSIRALYGTTTPYGTTYGQGALAVFTGSGYTARALVTAYLRGPRGLLRLPPLRASAKGELAFEFYLGCASRPGQYQAFANEDRTGRNSNVIEITLRPSAFCTDPGIIIIDDGGLAEVRPLTD